jgi:hypothetical protein
MAMRLRKWQSGYRDSNGDLVRGKTVPTEYGKRAMAIAKRMRGNRGYRNHWNQYICPHGINLGDPYGPDYMCGACESGVSALEFALGQAWQSVNRDRQVLLRYAYDGLVADIRQWADYPEDNPNRRAAFERLYVLLELAEELHCENFLR